MLGFEGLGIAIAIAIICLCVVFLSLLVRNSWEEKRMAMTDECFVVNFPRNLGYLFLVFAFIFGFALIWVALSQQENPDILFFYGLFAGISAMCLLLVHIAVKHRVFVKGHEIMVFRAFGAPFSFSFSDIALATRRGGPTYRGHFWLEDIAIKTWDGRKVRICADDESGEQFLITILLKVKAENLAGFERLQ